MKLHVARCRRVAVATAGLLLLLVLASCKSTATVELMDAATPATPAVETPAVESAPTESPPTETPAAETPATDVDARFALRGELPLTTAEVNELIDFVEEETGRGFIRPPVIVAQSRQAFIEGLQDDLADIEADAETSVRMLQALGLTDQGVGAVAEAFKELLLSPEGILGYYDPAADELYVPVGPRGDDAFRSLLVHELVHALDGQYTDLTVLEELIEAGEISGDFEPVAALQAVAEGRASSVQNRWIEANGVVQEVPDLGALADVPPALLLSLSIPYAFGELYVNLNGGAAGTWDALDDPPASSEEFMVPGTPRTETIVDVATPAADGPILDDVVYGANDMFVWLLGETLEPDPALLLAVFGAIDGWAGGRAVLWGDETESCVRIALAGDSESDLQEIREVSETWAAVDASSRSVVRDGDLVVVTGCAPYLP